MKLYVPDYYPEFQCIADACRHNCCIGWEIEIDEESYLKYANVSGKLGERLEKNISKEHSFILDEKERCPFLNDRNLCDLILELGEESLCNICRDHPRFRNFFEDRTEMGLGICCEAAGNLILGKKEPFHLLCIEDDEKEELQYPEEQAFYDFRDSLFSLLFDRAKQLKERILDIIHQYQIPVVKKPFAQWKQIYLKLERMDSVWEEYVQELDEGKLIDVFCVPEYETVQEQLLGYFFFRHLPDGVYDGSIPERIAFGLLSTYIISLLYDGISKKSGKNDLSLWVEIARIYSSEIEYSQENMEALLEMLRTDMKK